MSHTQRPRRSKRKTDLEEASTSSNGEEALTQPAPGTEVLVANIVQHLLTMSSNKMPIKRPNIIKHFLHGENKNFDDVFKMACNMMLDIYGLHVIQVDPELSKTVKKYICVGDKNTNVVQKLSMVHSKEQRLLFLVLIQLAVHGGTSTEDALYKFLEMMGIDKSEFAMLDTFICQLYIRKEKIVNEESWDYFYSQRAELEFPAENMVKVAKELLLKEIVNSSSITENMEE